MSTPNPGTKQYIENEKRIDKSPFLKKMRSQSRGEKYTEIRTQTTSDSYRRGYDAIDWSKK